MKRELALLLKRDFYCVTYFEFEGDCAVGLRTGLKNQEPPKKRGIPKGTKRPEHAEIMKGNKYALGSPGGGRISGYKNEYARQASHFCRLGASNNDLAKFFEVSTDTIHTWTLTYKEFAAAVKVGKDLSDERVVMSLYNKALGFEKVIEKEIVTKSGEIVIVKEKIYIPPSDAAISFWLKNRRRLEWRDRQEMEIGRAGEFEAMSDGELRNFIEGTVVEGGESEIGALAPPTEEES